MKKRGKKVKIDADLDEEVDHFEPESDDGFDDEERQMLNNAVGRRENNEEREVLKIYSSSEDSDEDDVEEGDEDGSEEGDEDGSEEGDAEKLYGGGVDSEMDSDIEKNPKEDGLPDSKAWGSDKKQYYNTDYVDQDYLGFDDEEAAIQEEKEADSIQSRLLSHLEGTSFLFDLSDETEDKKKEASRKREDPELEEKDDEQKVEVDLNSLSYEEAIKLLKNESPEMFPLLEHTKNYLLYLKEKVWPILKMVDEGSIVKCKAIHFLELINKLILNYTMNVTFYMHLKESGERTDNHPVMKRMNAFLSLLQELEVLRKELNPQIDTILEAKENGEELVYSEESKPVLKNRTEKRKHKLKLLEIKQKTKKMNKVMKRKLDIVQRDGYQLNMQKKVKQEEVQFEEPEEDSDDDDEEVEGAEGEKRSVTFNMLKNKGLTPRRKKENRNPRVKNRNKFKKAIKRRRGQVRTARTELERYGGEISGIKKNISKSIKLK